MIRLRYLPYIYILLFTWLLGNAFGCAHVPAPPRPMPGGITLRFAYSQESAGEAYKELAAEFHETHPDIVIHVQLNTDLDVFASPNPGLDVFEVPQSTVSFLAQQKVIRRLDPMLQEDPDPMAADFYPHVLDAFAWKGQVWAIPADVDPWVLYYNKDLFDQAGVSYPQSEWTWNDFLEKASRLTMDRGNHWQYGFGSNPKDAPEVVAFIYQHGGGLADTLLDPKVPTLDSPATLEAVQWYTDLALVYGAMAPPEAIEAYRHGRAWEAALVQHVAMWAGPLSSREGPSSAMEWPFRWGVVPLPRDKVSATLLELTGYCISAQSSQPHAAWLWIKAVTSSPHAARNLPPRRSIAQMPGYRQRVGDEIADVALRSAEHGLPSLPSPWLRKVPDWLSEALIAVLTEPLAVPEAMATVQYQAETAIAAQP